MIIEDDPIMLPGLNAAGADTATTGKRLIGYAIAAVVAYLIWRRVRR